MNEQEPS